jgi:hypothetical protein
MTGEPSGSPQLGKRYECERCGVELVCVRAGSGMFECHDAPMRLKAPKALPASD